MSDTHSRKLQITVPEGMYRIQGWAGRGEQGQTARLAGPGEILLTGAARGWAGPVGRRRSFNRGRRGAGKGFQHYCF